MDQTFQKVDASSKKTQVMSLIKNAIVTGDIQSGDHIVETKIAQQLGVGHGLIREALIELEHQGFVQRTAFSSTHVPKLTHEDALHIVDIRIQLEPLAFLLAGQNAAPKRLEEFQDLVDKARHAARIENVDLFLRHHLQFRQRIWELSGNRYLRQMLERVVMPLYALYLRVPENRGELEKSVMACVEHQQKIVDSFRAGDLEDAAKTAHDFLLEVKEKLQIQAATGKKSEALSR